MKKHSAVVDFGSSSGFTYGSSIKYINYALKEQTARFEALVVELAAFEPQSFEHVLADSKVKLCSSKEFNTPEIWEAMVHENAIERSKPHVQFFFAFHERANACYITSVILSAAVCEATANAVYEIYCISNKQPTAFKKFQLQGLREKWVSGMKLILPSYKFEKLGKLYESLDLMVRLRNSYMHHKISIWSSDGETALDENQTPAISFDESGLTMMRRILRLPEELMANLLDQISDPTQKFQYQMILT